MLKYYTYIHLISIIYIFTFPRVIELESSIRITMIGIKHKIQRVSGRFEVSKWSNVRKRISIISTVWSVIYRQYVMCSFSVKVIEGQYYSRPNRWSNFPVAIDIIPIIWRIIRSYDVFSRWTVRRCTRCNDWIGCDYGCIIESYGYSYTQQN